MNLPFIKTSICNITKGLPNQQTQSCSETHLYIICIKIKNMKLQINQKLIPLLYSKFRHRKHTEIIYFRREMPKEKIYEISIDKTQLID